MEESAAVNSNCRVVDLILVVVLIVDDDGTGEGSLWRSSNAKFNVKLFSITRAAHFIYLGIRSLQSSLTPVFRGSFLDLNNLNTRLTFGIAVGSRNLVPGIIADGVIVVLVTFGIIEIVMFIFGKVAAAMNELEKEMRMGTGQHGKTGGLRYSNEVRYSPSLTFLLNFLLLGLDSFFSMLDDGGCNTIRKTDELLFR